MMIEGHECYLGDDGTLDTIIVVNGREFRFDTEYASHYRMKSGEMTTKGLKELALECIGIADLEEWGPE